MESTTEEKVVVFDYEEIKNKDADLGAKIAKAYDSNGLGLCIVKGVPNFTEKRARLLPLAHQLANLPKEELDEITFEDIQYSLGWSHGKEKFKGKADYSKGSFYANAHLEHRIPKYEEQEFNSKVNPWPKSIPELKDAFKDLGQLIIDVGTELAYHIDKFVEQKESKYEKGKLVRVIKEADNVIGRLLHYFPSKLSLKKIILSGDKTEEEDPWCGLHNDSGSLTGLCPAMYLDKDGKSKENKILLNP